MSIQDSPLAHPATVSVLTDHSRPHGTVCIFSIDLILVGACCEQDNARKGGLRLA